MEHGKHRRAGSETLPLAAAALGALLAAGAAPTPVHGSDVPLTERAFALGLQDDPTWLRLLYFEPGKDLSRLVTEDFFLADNGAESPTAELKATLEAYSEPFPDAPDDHAICRFPARFFWLSQHLDLPLAERPEQHCPRFARWARFDQLDSVSLIMVSGYFGNPASSFGHILFKLNNGEDVSDRGLLDLGINYGALVPENEATFTYIVRGLFGGYQAGFSDRHYYTQDLTYSRTEFRDMWEYRLSLDDYHKRLVTSHVWEVAGKKFRYFFLRENCAYRMAQLMTLATGHDFVEGTSLWYAPVEAFHELQEIDADRNGSIIGAIRFWPSSQRVLYAEFAQLNNAETDVANAIIRDGFEAHRAALGTFPADRQLDVLDALLAYYRYRLVGDEEDQEQSLRDAKDTLLRHRLALPPVLDRPPAPIPNLRPPARGSRPTALRLGVAHADELDTWYALDYTAFDYSATGNNSLEGSELVVFDLSAGYNDSEGLFLDRLDFVRARKINRAATRIEGEDRRTWRAAAGLRRDTLDCTDCIDLYVGGAFGRALDLSPGITLYGMIGGSLNSGDDIVRAEPAIGAIIDRGHTWRTELTIGLEHRFRGSDSSGTAALTHRHSLAPSRELKFTALHRDSTAVRLDYVVHW